jgi:hypothetical protein
MVRVNADVHVDVYACVDLYVIVHVIDGTRASRDAYRDQVESVSVIVDMIEAGASVHNDGLCLCWRRR